MLYKDKSTLNIFLSYKMEKCTLKRLDLNTQDH